MTHTAHYGTILLMFFFVVTLWLYDDKRMIAQALSKLILKLVTV